MTSQGTRQLLKSRLFVSSLGFIVFLLAWKAISLNLASQSALPPPEKVFGAASEMWHSGEMLQDVGASLRRILTGFTIAFLSALAVGIVAARYVKTYRSVSIFLDLLSSIPPIAWTPLAILWFGIGDAPACFIVFLGAFFPMFLSVYSGITRVDRNLISAASTLGATPATIVSRVILPAALPSILTGVRAGITVGWFNVIAAELIGVRSGLGYKIQLSRTLLFSENVIALMLVIGIIGWIMAKAVALVGSFIAPWAIEDDSRPRWIARRTFVRRLFKRTAVSAIKTPSDAPRLQGNNTVFSTTSDTKAALLEVRGVSKSFPGQNGNDSLSVLQDISFDVRPNEVFTVIGPNGSGKTTLLRILAGLMQADGSILFRGKKVDGPSWQRTVIFQDFALFPWLTAAGNVDFAHRASLHAERNGDANRLNPGNQTEALLQLAGLQSFQDTYPADLSGGMRQRLAMARALAVEPDLILMDEPFASFDPLVREESQQTILSLLRQKPVTVLLVTHDLDEAIFMSDRILVLSQRPGRAKTIIKINFPHPRSPSVRRSEEFQRLRTDLWEIFRSPFNETQNTDNPTTSTEGRCK